MKPIFLIPIQFGGAAPFAVAIQLSQPVPPPWCRPSRRQNDPGFPPLRRQAGEVGAPLPAARRPRGARGARRCGCLVLAIVLLGLLAPAQSNKPPGPQDYAAFSPFITERNIFDPGRQPHYASGPRTPVRRTRNASAPDLQLVGIMSYEKGRFAFFNSNSGDLKKVLPAGAKIADHTIVEISATEVQLESADKKNPLRLKIGEGLRQENGRWVLSDGSPVAAADATSETRPSGDENAGAPPASTAEPNDVLKRLMQLREKENQ